MIWLLRVSIAFRLFVPCHLTNLEELRTAEPCLHCLSAFCPLSPKTLGDLTEKQYAVSIAFRLFVPCHPVWRQKSAQTRQVSIAFRLFVPCHRTYGQVTGLPEPVVSPLPFGFLSPVTPRRRGKSLRG